MSSDKLMLSVAMIVKNEVETLESTVKSVSGYVDEVVIGLDVESDDGTDKLAEKLADKVVPIYLSEELAKKGPRDITGATSADLNNWGFSAARNRVLDACDKASWRLILDGHELVRQPENLKEVVNKASGAGCDGVEMFLHFEPDERGIDRLLYRQARLLGPQVKYNNPIHNVPVIKRMFESNDVSVEHRKKDQNATSKQARDVQRSDANINGLKAKVEANPTESRSWFYLAVAYKENGRWQEAIDTYKRYLGISVWPEERWHARTDMGTCYSYLGDTVNAREQFTLALEEFPAMVEAYYYLADLAYKQQRFREAEAFLEKCIDMEIPNCKLFVSPEVYMYNRYDLMSMVYNHLGKYDKAVEMAEKILANGIKGPRIENNIRIWREYLEKQNAQL